MINFKELKPKTKIEKYPNFGYVEKSQRLD